MTPAERLKQIELKDFYHDKHEVEWLIYRVKRLTIALEESECHCGDPFGKCDRCKALEQE